MAPHGVILWGHPPHGWNELDELVPAMASAFSRNIYAHEIYIAVAYPLACSDIWTGTKQIQLRSPPGGLSRPRGTIEVCSVTVSGQKKYTTCTNSHILLHVGQMDLQECYDQESTARIYATTEHRSKTSWIALLCKCSVNMHRSVLFSLGIMNTFM